MKKLKKPTDLVLAKSSRLKASEFLRSLLSFVVLILLLNNHFANAATFIFPLCESTLGTKEFDCITPQDKQILSYDQVADQWRPRTVNGLSYRGTWDASGAYPLATSPGDYFITSIAGNGSGTHYNVGDWSVYNGVTFEKVASTNKLTSFNGRTGLVEPVAGDYSLSDLSDVVIPFLPELNQVLKYNGTKWEPATLALGEGISDLPVCSAGQSLSSLGGSLSCRSIPSALVESVNAEVGDVVLTTDDIPEGDNNKYFTDAKVFLAPITAPNLVDSSSVADGDSLQIALGKIQTQINSKIIPFNGGDPGEYFSYNKTWQVILGAQISNVPAGSIAATNVQAAIDELEAEKQDAATFIDWSSNVSIDSNETIHPTRLSLGASNANKSVVTDASGNIVTGPISAEHISYLKDVNFNIKDELDGKQDKISKTSTQEMKSLKIFGPDKINYVELSTFTTADRVFIFPSAYGANNEVLATDGAGVMSWIPLPSAPVTSVNGEIGEVVLTTADVAEGTNKYYQDAKVILAPITNLTLTNSAIATGNSVELSLGKLQAQATAREPSFSVGSAGEYFSYDKTWKHLNASAVSNTPSGTIVATTLQAAIDELDTKKRSVANVAEDVLATEISGLVTNSSTPIDNTTDTVITALGKLQAQITTLQSTKLNLEGDSLISGTFSGLPDPAIADDVANKAYVDTTILLDPVADLSQVPSEYSPACPPFYISVPAISYYPGPSFCVMKYEANVGSPSVAAGIIASGTDFPVVNISRDNARVSCKLNGPGYDLISNHQWQTIARNVADEGYNWSSGTAYSGGLNHGHSDQAPYQLLPAALDDSPCVYTGDEATCSEAVWHTQRRTHKLSNGEIIWDLAGNAWEWVRDSSNLSQGADAFVSNVSSGNRQRMFGNDQTCDAPNSPPFYCGMGHGYFNGDGGAILRGGAFVSLYESGIFATSLENSGSYTSPGVGFRCVFVP